MQRGRGQKVSYFVIRIGGWDGIALQAELWLHLLSSMRKRIHLVTGEVEEEHGPIDIASHGSISTEIIPELHLDNQRFLYEMSFKRRFDRERWLGEFVAAKGLLKHKFQKSIRDTDLIILHNFSIKHLIPSAWAAMLEIIIENPKKRFISIAADSPFERSYIMEKFASDVLLLLKEPKLWHGRTPKEISRQLVKNGNSRYIALPGPDTAPNLKYVVLNSNQRKTFHNIYGIPDDDLMVIHDMGRFTPERQRKKPPRKEFPRFFEYLKRNQLTGSKEEMDKNDVYLISPVRPIRRKKLLEIAFAARLFKEYLKRKRRAGDVILVVTHPNRDERPYFTELKRFAKRLGLRFVFLGDEIKLRKSDEGNAYTYDEVMNLFSYLNSTCIVGSEFGGWENGILEATEHKIPVAVNPLLPSFQDMMALGYNYVPAPIIVFSDLAQTRLDIDYLRFPSIKTFYDKLYSRIYIKNTRRTNVNHNYLIGLKTQSIQAARPLIRKFLDSFEK